MFNLDKFISDSVTFRPVSMFAPDIEANKEKLTEEIKGKKVCVIGGAGSIGSSFIKAVLRFEFKSVAARSVCSSASLVVRVKCFSRSLANTKCSLSAVCDDFVKAEVFTKKEYAGDADGMQYASEMDYNSETYPVVYFKSDTTGEKAYEKFYAPVEKIGILRFMALGVVE